MSFLRFQVWFCSLLFATSLDAQSFEENSFHGFDGKIGSMNYRIVLKFGNNTVSGHLHSSKCEQKITISGSNTSNSLFLEGRSNGKAWGYLKAQFIRSRDFDTLKGTWYDPSRNVAEQFLFLGAFVTTADPFGKQYPLYGSDSAVEDFSIRIKKAIVTGDKAWIARHVSYPFVFHTLKNDVNTPHAINDSFEFVKKYDSIVTPGFVQYYRKVCPLNLWGNSHGVAVENGHLWIQNTMMSDVHKHEYEIKAISPRYD